MLLEIRRFFRIIISSMERKEKKKQMDNRDCKSLLAAGYI
jgi:hypothetical protein